MNNPFWLTALRLLREQSIEHQLTLIKLHTCVRYDNLDINTAVQEKEEIFKAIQSLKNGKAQGHDNLNAELFKADSDLAATTLQPRLAALLEGEEVPADWTNGVIIRIPKKGALSDCNNWRGIRLLSAPSKILAKIIIKWISDAVDAGMRKEQADFRKEQGCTDQIFTLCNITEQCTEWQLVRWCFIRYGTLLSSQP